MTMPPLEFFVNLFGGPFRSATDADRERSERGLLKALAFLSDLDFDYLQQYPHTPSIFDSGIRYHHDDGVEKWYGIEEALHRGYGDCKVFAAWLTAELHKLGVAARPHIKWRMLGTGSWMFHCLVAIPHDALPALSHILPILDTPSGPVVEPSTIPGDTDWIVDPSRATGMDWEQAYAGTNRRPNTFLFWHQLEQLMGRMPRSIATLMQPVAPPVAAGWFGPMTAWPWAPLGRPRAFTYYAGNAPLMLPSGEVWQ